ncbi:maltokinase N-terminal cap-like domain-containing protein [Streptomyces sp. SCSIO ZS0520]|uniref:maltokinase N-terminal cap-like domain-containing protein n=1 Tax=Streptomyces sp. SCSIO ZS0520 TaxID=2892996 RepID=UPI0021DA77EE|nr:1,4-alpha-glucan branching protein [Streptomyces sp. SCSIO ZS0520]
MAVIHRTTLTPTKLELLASWLPAQPWYQEPEGGPRPAKAGGFRLDDPAGEVGIEFMVVTEGPEAEPRSYLVPLTYRAAPLEEAADALLGTAEHGVLGRRWVYDGAHDPVLVRELGALFLGKSAPQAQSESDTPDPTVRAHYTGPATAPLTPRLHRALTPLPDGAPEEAAPALGRLFAGWQLPDGTGVRGVFAVVEEG